MATGLAQRHGCATLVMGCTEIPLALRSGPATQGLHLVDAAQLTARALALSAYRASAQPTCWS